MASCSQQPIVFKPYDPLAPKAKHKARASLMENKTSSCKLNASLIAEDRGDDEPTSLSGVLEQEQTCNRDPPLHMSHSTGKPTSNLYQHCVAVADRLGDPALGSQGIGPDVDASIAASTYERESSVNAANMPLIVEDSVEAYSEPLRNDSDADCSDVIGVDRLRRCKRTRSHSADANLPVVGAPCSSPRRNSVHDQSGKRRKFAKGVRIDAELASPFKSLASFRDNDQQRNNLRGEEGQGDSDYGSSESSDQEGRLEHNAKKQLLHDAVSVARLRVDQCSTTEASEIEDSANEDDRVGSEVGKGSRFGSALFYHQHSEVLPAAPQQCRDASVETLCRPRQPRREKPRNIALRRKHLSSDTVRSKATRTSTHTDKDPGRQHHTSSASASTPCGPNDDHKTPPNLFEISGMSLHFKPNSDTAIAHVRALNPQSHAMAPIPGLEAFGAEYQTVHWVQRTQESWLLVGFRNRTTEPISCTGRGRKSLGFEPESHISQDTTGLETSGAGNSSEEDDDHATGGVRGLSSREPWKESDNYRLLSYRDKKELPWDEIFKHFPDRSVGAVRTHYHNLLKQKKV